MSRIVRFRRGATGPLAEVAKLAARTRRSLCCGTIVVGAAFHVSVGNRYYWSNGSVAHGTGIMTVACGTAWGPATTYQSACESSGLARNRDVSMSLGLGALAFAVVGLGAVGFRAPRFGTGLLLGAAELSVLFGAITGFGLHAEFHQTCTLPGDGCLGADIFEGQIDCGTAWSAAPLLSAAQARECGVGGTARNRWLSAGLGTAGLTLAVSASGIADYRRKGD